MAVAQEKFSINSMTLRADLKKWEADLESVSTSASRKIAIGNFLCKDAHQMLAPNQSRDEKVINAIEPIFRLGDGLPPQDDPFSRDRLRTSPLWYNNQKVSYFIAKKAFEGNLRETLDETPYFHVLRHMLHSPFRDHMNIAAIRADLEAIFTRANVSTLTMMNIADIFTTEISSARGAEMLDIVRAREREEARARDRVREVEPERPRTVYSDSQNVHDEKINQSVLEACSNLIADMEEHVREVKYQDDFTELWGEFENVTVKPPLTKKVFNSVITRVHTDTARFTFKGAFFSMHRLFTALWCYINRSPNKADLLIRLAEEIVSMDKYCSTGHMARFINVLAGFGASDRYSVKISDKAQIHSVVTSLLNKALSAASDEVKDSIIEEDTSPYMNFIKTLMNTKVAELKSEYNALVEDVTSALKNYTRYTWTYSESIGFEWTNSV